MSEYNIYSGWMASNSGIYLAATCRQELDDLVQLALVPVAMDTVESYRVHVLHCRDRMAYYAADCSVTAYHFRSHLYLDCSRRCVRHASCHCDYLASHCWHLYWVLVRPIDYSAPYLLAHLPSALVALRQLSAAVAVAEAAAVAVAAVVILPNSRSMMAAVAIELATVDSDSEAAVDNYSRMASVVRAGLDLRVACHLCVSKSRQFRFIVANQLTDLSIRHTWIPFHGAEFLWECRDRAYLVIHWNFLVDHPLDPFVAFLVLYNFQKINHFVWKSNALVFFSTVKEMQTNTQYFIQNNLNTCFHWWSESTSAQANFGVWCEKIHKKNEKSILISNRAVAVAWQTIEKSHLYKWTNLPRPSKAPRGGPGL